MSDPNSCDGISVVVRTYMYHSSPSKLSKTIFAVHKFGICVSLLIFTDYIRGTQIWHLCLERESFIIFISIDQQRPMYGLMILTLSLLSPFQPASAAFDVKTKFRWLDSSCNGKENVLNTAGQNMVDMASAAEQAVVSQENDVFKRTLKAFFNQEPQYGVLLQSISIFWAQKSTRCRY